MALKLQAGSAKIADLFAGICLYRSCLDSSGPTLTISRTGASTTLSAISAFRLRRRDVSYRPSAMSGRLDMTVVGSGHLSTTRAARMGIHRLDADLRYKQYCHVVKEQCKSGAPGSGPVRASQVVDVCSYWCRPVKHHSNQQQARSPPQSGSIGCPG